eukprot:TRINITY_DN46990_c0_g1_i1.p1 TRINITY_DN46990_c0_g1~~TRINITY_DN46990_c0_g1_i1.p1  ORF type:complete len:608 (-),score=85.24 TRINITY_DN46990_c0_g1_i1:124-1947(-)
MRIEVIDSQPFTEELFIEKRYGSSAYTVTFSRWHLASVERAANAALEHLQRDDAVTEPVTANAVAELSRACLTATTESGLNSAASAGLVAESLRVAATLITPRQEVMETLQPSNTIDIVAVLEMFLASIDLLFIDIFVSVIHLEQSLRPQWNFLGHGSGGQFYLQPTVLTADLSEVAADKRMLHALQGVALWAFALIVRAVGYSSFSALRLWDFVSGGPLGAFLFSKCALSFHLWSDHVSDVPIPEDITEVQDAVLDASLGLVSQDVAFAAGIALGDGNIHIQVRNERLRRHHAALASAAAETNFLDCLLAYPWATRPVPSSRIAALASFVVALVGSSPPPELIAEIDPFAQCVRSRASELWDALAPMTLPTRAFLRDIATLAHIAAPSSEIADVVMQRCLSVQRAGGLEALLHDSLSLAALIVFAANLGRIPAEDDLSGVVAYLDAPARGRVAGRLESWRGPVRAGALQPWLELLSAAPEDALQEDEEEPPAPEPEPTPPPWTSASTVEHPPSGADVAPALQAYSTGAPAEFCCAFSGRLLLDPVTSSSGHAFERSSLARALAANGGLCPVTGTPLALEDCRRDPELRLRILQFVRQNRPSRERTG